MVPVVEMPCKIAHAKRFLRLKAVFSVIDRKCLPPIADCPQEQSCAIHKPSNTPCADNRHAILHDNYGIFALYRTIKRKLYLERLCAIGWRRAMLDPLLQQLTAQSRT